MAVFVVSMAPLLGTRAGIVIAAFMGFGTFRTLVVCLAGSLAPAPFILILFNKFTGALERKRILGLVVRRAKRLVTRQNRNARSRLAFALFVFAALPLPLTGVWASSIIAAALGLHLQSSLLAIAAGTFVNAIFLMLLAFIFPGLFWII